MDSRITTDVMFRRMKWGTVALAILLVLTSFVVAVGESTNGAKGVAILGDIPAAVPHRTGLLSSILQSGPWGFLNWLCILGLALAALPLGAWAVVNSIRLQSLRIPLSVKMLVLFATLLVILGMSGAVIGSQSGMFCLCVHPAGESYRAYIALNISRALYSLTFALCGCLVYLFFISASALILHFRSKKLSGARI